MARTRLHSLFSQDQIRECYDINDLKKYINFDGWLLLDLDNTAIEPDDHHQEMGGDQWFVRFMDVASKVPLSEGDPNHLVLVLSVYHAVQYFVTLKLVQPEIVDIINLFQDVGKGKVLAVTARGSEIIKPTIRELNKLGINFSSGWGNNEFVLDVGDNQHPPIFKNGILFCGGKPKDKCFKNLIDILGKTPNVLMVDDKCKYLDAMKKMVEESYQGTFIGLHYRRLDEKVQQHDFNKAQNKLQEVRANLPEEAQQALVKLGM